MPKFIDWLNPLSSKNPFNKIAFGTPGKTKNVSTLRPEQEQLYQQLVKSGMQPGAGGAFGQAADYYRGLMDENSPDYQAFAAPALRQYNEEIVPGLAEQFAGMGSGGLSSSGFNQTMAQGATDLSERLGALRAQLRQHGAAGLANIGQMGLNNYSQPMMTQQPTQGFLPTALPAVAGAVLGPAGAAAGQMASNWLTNRMSYNNSPYNQNQYQASPRI